MIKKIYKKIGGKYVFLISVAALYGAVFIFDTSIVVFALNFFVKLCLKILPVLTLVFVFMLLSNLFLNARKVVKYIGESSGMKGWLISIVGGIVSSGPIYVWYPLLSDLREKGMKNSLIATFLYNRAVKIALLPLMIYYFGIVFTAVFTFYMIVFSIFNGIMVDNLVKGNIHQHYENSSSSK